MANWYVYSGAGGAGTGADWTNAYVTLNAALTAKAAGDVFFVADDHSQNSGAALTCTSPGTEANPCRIYCVRRTGGSVPPVAADLRTTAVIQTGGNFILTLNGSVSECYGIVFATAGNTAAAFTIGAAVRSWRFVGCKFQFAVGSVAASRITLGGAGALTVLEGCSTSFQNVGQGIIPIGRVIIRNMATVFVSSATIPTVLFVPGTSSVSLFVEGVDLSASSSGKSLMLGTTTVSSSAIFKDCKLGASVGVVSGTIPSTGGMDVTLVRCDDGDTNYRTERYNYLGNQVTDETVYLDGGATDGTTPISWKITPLSATCRSAQESLPISVWNETTGSSVTVTVEATWGGSSIPNNDFIWIDVEYLGTSGFPLASVATSKAAALDTATAYSSSSSTWTGSGLVTFWSMSATFTPQEKGPITIYVKRTGVGDVNAIWIDPKPVIT